MIIIKLPLFSVPVVVAVDVLKRKHNTGLIGSCSVRKDQYEKQAFFQFLF